MIHRKNRTHFFTLLEVLVSLGLIVILLTTVSYFYQQVDWINREIEKSQQRAFQKSYVENRLADILPKAVPKVANRKNDFYFFTSSDANGLLMSGNPSLVFTYDNGIIQDPTFANHVLGRLYLDTNGIFSLATWPSPNRWEINPIVPMKKEVLTEGVEKVVFKFYLPPDKGQVKGGKKNEIEPKNHWHKEWKQEYNVLPALIKIKIKRKEDRMTFIFPLSYSGMPIVYDR